MKRKYKNGTYGFTLIELLVVISIIALLSSTVLAALSTVRGKAGVGAGLEFDTYNYHAFGSDAAAVYTLDETSPPFMDTSGNNNNLSATAGVTSVPGIKGNALYFNGAGQYASTSANINGATPLTSWTISAWVNVASDAPVGDIFLSVYPTTGPAAFQDRPYFKFSPTGFYVTWTDNTGSNHSISETNSRSYNTWYQVTLTHYDSGGSSQTILYVDGAQVAADPNDYTSASINAPLYLGAFPGDTTNWRLIGMLDQVEIYTHALVASDVYKLYAEDATKYGLSLR